MLSYVPSPDRRQKRLDKRKPPFSLEGERGAAAVRPAKKGRERRRAPGPGLGTPPRASYARRVPADRGKLRSESPAPSGMESPALCRASRGPSRMLLPAKEASCAGWTCRSQACRLGKQRCSSSQPTEQSRLPANKQTPASLEGDSLRRQTAGEKTFRTKIEKSYSRFWWLLLFFLLSRRKRKADEKQECM